MNAGVRDAIVIGAVSCSLVSHLDRRVSRSIISDFREVHTGSPTERPRWGERMRRGAAGEVKVCIYPPPIVFIVYGGRWGDRYTEAINKPGCRATSFSGAGGAGMGGRGRGLTALPV